MGKKVDLLRRLADSADLQAEPVPGKTGVELLGDCRVLIERHRGVTSYDREKIGILASYGHIEIQGANLEVIQMTRRQLIVTGRIEKVLLFQGDSL